MDSVNEHVARTARTAEFVEQLLAVVQELEDMHLGRKFPLDGHLVGSIGEAAAEAIFAITLATASTAGYDAVADEGARWRSKRRLERRVWPSALRRASMPGQLTVLRLSKLPGAGHEVVHNGPLGHALQVAGPTQRNGQALMPDFRRCWAHEGLECLPSSGTCVGVGNAISYRHTRVGVSLDGSCRSRWSGGHVLAPDASDEPGWFGGDLLAARPQRA